jgi:hypothetical protein
MAWASLHVDVNSAAEIKSSSNVGQCNSKGTPATHRAAASSYHFSARMGASRFGVDVGRSFCWKEKLSHQQQFRSEVQSSGPGGARNAGGGRFRQQVPATFCDQITRGRTGINSTYRPPYAAATSNQATHRDRRCITIHNKLIISDKKVMKCQ